MPVCGSSGDAFAFIEKANTRYAVTTDLTLTQDSFIQFDFSASCSVSNSCYAIELEYSLDLGLTWQPLLRDCLPISLDCTRYQLQRVLVSDTFNKWGRVTLPIPPYASFLNVLLPPAARDEGVRVRWWQPKHDGLDQNDWALDNVLIGGSATQRTGIVDTFRGAALPQHERAPADSAPTGRILQEPRAEERGTGEGEWRSGAQVRERGTGERESGGVGHRGEKKSGGVEQKRGRNKSGGWSDGCFNTLGVIVVSSFSVSEHWMFHDDCLVERFCDSPDGVMVCGSHDGREVYAVTRDLTPTQGWIMQFKKYSDTRWAIDSFYIGPACPDNCGGHGDCLKERCLCDPGFSGPNCYLSQTLRSSLKERFDTDEVRPDLWLSLEGGRPCTDCGVLVEDTALYFGGANTRQAVTTDLDLRGSNATQFRWIQREGSAEKHAIVMDRGLNVLCADSVSNSGCLAWQIVVGCEVESCGELHSVLLEYRKDARMDSWQQVQEECLPSSVNNVGCSPFQFHEATIYSAVNSSSWSRVTLQLPDHVSSSATQFRWIQREGSAEKQSWAVDQVYIGEACPRLCSGHGYCTSGAVCICDEGHQGDDCSISSSDLPSYIKDNFESESVTEVNWQQIQGGGIGSGCGQLSPHAHGDSLYFTGCKTRQAVTRPLDLTRASKIMFVLQIGSVAQTDSCNMDLGEPNTVDKAVLLQYSINNGITWHVIAQHQPKDFIQAQRVSYNIPLEARVKGVQLRWWQPRHNGTGHDQWALDHVEVVLTRKQNYMMNFSRQTGLRHFYSRKRRALRRHF
ncbi:UNVERIFIED_CONTAM: hypothetical protein FKN15_006968 [Acipenser sinensis]